MTGQERTAAVGLQHACAKYYSAQRSSQDHCNGPQYTIDLVPTSSADSLSQKNVKMAKKELSCDARDSNPALKQTFRSYRANGKLDYF